MGRIVPARVGEQLLREGGSAIQHVHGKRGNSVAREGYATLGNALELDRPFVDPKEGPDSVPVRANVPHQVAPARWASSAMTAAAPRGAGRIRAQRRPSLHRTSDPGDRRRGQDPQIYVIDGEAGKMLARMVVDNRILHTAGGVEPS